MADKLKDGEKCEADLGLTSQALKECQLIISGAEPQFWQKPGFVISGFVVTLGLGFVLGLVLR